MAYGGIPIQTRSALGLILACAIALVAVAGCGGGGGSSDGTSAGSAGGEVDTASVSLPEEIDGYPEIVAAVEAQGAPANLVEEQKANQEKVAEATAAAYSKAFGGAGAAYRQYADAELMKMPYVIAIRAEAPGMVIGPVYDPDYLGLENAEREVVSVGEVECQVAWTPTPKGNEPEPSSELTTSCQRVGSGVSVFVGSGGFTGPGGLKAMAGFAEAAWKSVAEA